MKPVYVKLTGVVSLLVLLLFLFGMQPLPAVDSLTGGLPPASSEESASSAPDDADRPETSPAPEDDPAPEETPDGTDVSSGTEDAASSGGNTSKPSDVSSGASSGVSSAGSSSSPPSSGGSSDSSSGGTTPSKPSPDHSGGSSSGAAGGSGGGTPDVAPAPNPSPAPVPAPSGKIVAGYYAGWSSYKGYTPSRIPAGQLTHLNYAFAKIDPVTNAIALADPVNDRNNFAAIRKLKQSHKGLTTLISVGGWDYSTYFSDVASTSARREAFAQSCVDFILEHGFDGVDLDWEYPVSGGLAGNTNRPQDRENFTLLLKAIREKLDAQGWADGRKYYLTIAGAANSSYLSKIEPAKVAALVDHIFVMTYDIHGPWDSYSDLSAPLYQPAENSPQYKNSVYDGISAYLSRGVPANKLVLGMPFYGYIYQGVSAQNNGLYSAFSSAKSISYDSIRSSYLGQPAFARLWHQRAQVPYLYGNNTFITYEDPQSIAAKASLARSMGLAGIGAWELSHDTSGALLSSAYKSLY